MHQTCFAALFLGCVLLPCTGHAEPCDVATRAHWAFDARPFAGLELQSEPERYLTQKYAKKPVT